MVGRKGTHMCAYQQRHSYLRERGFAFDPFDEPVAESEMFAHSQATGFLSYFVPCDVLRDTSGRSVFTPDPATTMLVYGPRGSGRTAIRFAWEVSHRVARSHSLRVTHVLNDLSQGATLRAETSTVGVRSIGVESADRPHVHGRRRSSRKCRCRRAYQ